MNLKVLLTILLISISVNSYSLKIGLGAGFDGYSSGISVPMDLNNIRIEPKIEIFFDDNSMDAEYFDNKIGRYKERSSSKIDVSLGLGLYYLIGSEKTIYPYIGIQYLYSIYELLSETLYEDERHIKREDIYLYNHEFSPTFGLEYKINENIYISIYALVRLHLSSKRNVENESGDIDSSEYNYLNLKANSGVQLKMYLK